MSNFNSKPDINNVSLIGLGALGILFGHPIAQAMPAGNFHVIADTKRIDRYKREGVYNNDKPCSFNYITPDESVGPSDLVIVAVKFKDLDQAVQDIRNQVGDRTIILSLLNGISSEEILAKEYGFERVLYCTAQGMDAVRTANRLTWHNQGTITLGEREPGKLSENVIRVSRFLHRMQIAHEPVTDMVRRQWGKFMLNVGINQVVTVFEGNYGTVQTDGPARTMMIDAMREVVALSEPAGIHLTQEDISFWLRIIEPLNPSGTPSMRQDHEAGQPSEVELFAGTVLRLGHQYGIETPVNQMLYERILAAEKRMQSPL